MEKKYPAMMMVSSLLKTISIIVFVVGVGGAIWFSILGKQLLGEASQWSVILSIAVILISVVSGVVIYALGDLFRCMMDIESNTRKKGRVSIMDDSVDPPPVKARRNGGSGLPRVLKVEPAETERRPAR